MIFPHVQRKLTYNEFDRQTEREVAAAFRRYPRDRPDPAEVPFYPYLHNLSPSPPPQVNFSLGFNPFAVCH